MQNLVIKYEDKVALVGSVDCDGRTLEFGEAFAKLSKDVGSKPFDMMLNNIIGKFVLYTSCRMLPVEDKPKQMTFTNKIDMLVQKFLLPGLASLLVSAAGGEGEKAEEVVSQRPHGPITVDLDIADLAVVQDFADKNGISKEEALAWIVGYFRAELLVPPKVYEAPPEEPAPEAAE